MATSSKAMAVARTSSGPAHSHVERVGVSTCRIDHRHDTEIRRAGPGHHQAFGCHAVGVHRDDQGPEFTQVVAMLVRCVQAEERPRIGQMELHLVESVEVHLPNAGDAYAFSCRSWKREAGKGAREAGPLPRLALVHGNDLKIIAAGLFEQERL